MAQLVARLVRNEKVGGSNPPSSTTGRHPIRMSVFCMFGRVGAVPVVVLIGAAGVRGACWAGLWGRAAVCAGGRRPAREIATREPAARSGRSRGPPWPCRHPPAPRPGPATAHRYGRALRSLRRPSHRRCSRNSRLSLLLAAPLVFRAPSGPAAREIATREPAARSGRSRSPPVPSGPFGALHTSRAGCADVWLGVSFRRPATPCHRP